MVKSLLFAVLFPLTLFSLELAVRFPPEDLILEQSPIRGEIVVRTEEELDLEKMQFTWQEGILETELISQGQEQRFTQMGMRAKREVSRVYIYAFSLPGKERGSYLFPTVTLKIGGKKVHSQPVSYEVVGAQKSRGLQMYASIKPQRLYPGQRALFAYQIISQYNFTAIRQDLPLLRADGFRKIGSIRQEPKVSDGYVVLEIQQDVLALQPGSHTFPSSFIEVRPYEESLFGPNYARGVVRAESPPLSIKVLDFPQRDRPPSFYGAIGSFSLRSEISSSSLSVGDSLHLSLHFTCQDHFALQELKAPPLGEDERFSLFQFSDFPPQITLNEKSKSFQWELRPLSSSIRELPALSFSSFDPEQEQYRQIHLPAIPLEIVPLQVEEKPLEGDQAPSPSQELAEELPVDNPSLPPLEIHGIVPLSLERREERCPSLLSLQAPHFEKALLWVSLLLFFQWLGRKWLLRFLRRERKKKNAREWLKKARRVREEERYFLLEQAVLSHFIEQGERAESLGELSTVPFLSKEWQECIRELESLLFIPSLRSPAVGDRLERVISQLIQRKNS